jgi:hypothetical protein
LFQFQAGADFNQNIVRAVRRRSPETDFQTAHEAGLHGLNDEVVLAAADDLVLIREALEAGKWINRIDSLPL